MTQSTVRASDISFNEGVLRFAAVHKRVARFRYAKGPHSPVEVREFTPTRVYTSHDGHILIAGPDEDRDGAPRQYRLDRIKGDVKIP